MNKNICRNGEYYNEFGSIVYPRRTPTLRKYQEFEIHAVAYINLRNFFKDDNRVKGEFTYRFMRCDIAILNKKSEVVLIIEVKKNNREVVNSQGQIEAYKKYSKVYVLDNMQDAEDIISILVSKKLIST